MKKSMHIILALMSALGGFLCACTSAEPVVDPVALTVAAIDINETFQWVDAERTKTAQAQVTEMPPITHIYGFNLNASNTIPETAIYDSGGIKVAMLSIQYGGVFGPSLILLIENASQNAIRIRVNEVVVNDFMLKSMLESDVASGQSRIEELVLSGETLERSGIVDIQTIAFSLGVTDSDNRNQSITTGRIQVQSNADPGTVRSHFETGKVLVEREGIKISLKKMKDDKVLACIENNTDTDIVIRAEEVKVNGTQVGYRYQDYLLAGTTSVQELVLNAGDLIAEGILAIETVELRIMVTRRTDQKIVFETEPLLLTFD